LSSGALTMAGGTTLTTAYSNRTISNNITINGATSFQPGTLTGLSTGTTDTFTVNGVISGGGSLTKVASIGTAANDVLTLGGVNTYTGATTVSGGTLALAAGGSIANSSKIVVGDTSANSGAGLNVSAVTSGLVLAAGQTLAGFGSVTGGVTLSTSTSALAPGNVVGNVPIVGSLTIAGNLSVSNSALNYVLNTPNASGQANGNGLTLLTSGGTLTIGQGETLNVTPGAGFSAGKFDLIEAAVPITDNSSTFSGWSVNGLPAGYSGSFALDTDPSNGDSALELVVTAAAPEPGSLGLLSLGTTALIGRRRRVVR
jgi:fibronectin-binding autotransporter adhesin